jgi:hypothetical protein
VSWQVDDEHLTVETSVPEGVRAVLSVEGHNDVELPAGTATHTMEKVR